VLQSGSITQIATRNHDDLQNIPLVDNTRLASDSASLAKVSGGALQSNDNITASKNIIVQKATPFLQLYDTSGTLAQILMQGGASASFYALSDRFRWTSESSVPLQLDSRKTLGNAYVFSWYNYSTDSFENWVVFYHHTTKTLCRLDVLYGSITVNQHIRPQVSGTQSDLGASGYKWRDLFLARYAYLGNVSSLPTASSTYRGVLVQVQGGAGVADKLCVCVKKADDTYGWFDLISDTFV